MKARAVLLTGVTGFIGSHLLTALIENGSTVCAVVRKQSNTWRIAPPLGHPLVKVYSDEIGDLRRAFTEQTIDCVLHLATKYIKHHTTTAEEQEMIAANVTFPTTILDLMREYSVRHIVTTGTFFEYDLAGRATLTESSPEKPYNFYARTKLLFDNVVKEYVKKYEFSAVHLRLFAPYGPKDNEKLIPFLIKSFLKKQPVHLTPAEQQWNFTYVGDIVEAYLSAMEFCCGLNGGYEMFNIGATRAVSVKTVVEILERILATPGMVSYDKPYPPDEIFYANCDGKKAERLLGWKAQTDIETGLKKVVEYYREQQK